MRKLFSLPLFLVCFQLSAQNHTTCDGMRYRTDVFETVTSTKGLKYGEGTTFNGTFQELYLDIYEPAQDNAEMRPAIILAFGGSYISGQREDIDWLCEAYARKGFVAVTIDYRLYDGPLIPLPSAAVMQDVVAKSVGDMKAAIRYLREDAATNNFYRIDPDYIFVGGISAGSITAAHTAVLDTSDTFTPELWSIIESNGGLEGYSSDNLEYSTEVRGFVNFSGGLNDASWIDAEDPPFVSIHDEFDGIVPYGEGFASIFFFDIIYLEGSLIMSEVADSVGVENQLYTIEGSLGHVSYFGSENARTNNVNRSTDFLYELICPDMISSLSAVDESALSLEVYPNPTINLLFLNYENNLSLRIQLYDVLGQKVGEWKDVNQLDLSRFEDGVYFLKVRDEGSSASVVKKISLKK